MGLSICKQNIWSGKREDLGSDKHMQNIRKKLKLIKARNEIKISMSYYLGAALGWARFFHNKDWASVWAKSRNKKMAGQNMAEYRNIIRGQVQNNNGNHCSKLLQGQAHEGG